MFTYLNLCKRLKIDLSKGYTVQPRNKSIDLGRVKKKTLNKISSET